MESKATKWFGRIEKHMYNEIMQEAMKRARTGCIGSGGRFE